MCIIVGVILYARRRIHGHLRSCSFPCWTCCFILLSMCVFWANSFVNSLRHAGCSSLQPSGRGKRKEVRQQSNYINEEWPSVCIRVCMFACLHLCLCVLSCLHVCVRACACVLACLRAMHMGMCLCIDICHVCTFAYARVYRYVCAGELALDRLRVCGCSCMCMRFDLGCACVCVRGLVYYCVCFCLCRCLHRSLVLVGSTCVCLASTRVVVIACLRMSLRFFVVLSCCVVLGVYVLFCVLQLLDALIGVWPFAVDSWFCACASVRPALFVCAFPFVDSRVILQRVRS
jgi:hypothetical protein